ncbi:hypothetical protein CcCBS67573_g09365 [Chytriomyces confervae]|uniref:Uncharacterized protein n=1 Tax=Chytriomyces confervae TaxID=246404 RepID=A0A507DXR5_9FUNG|nr:hypothetical protein CcCBS67573_g09365 [Chytriomyces confervae]
MHDWRMDNVLHVHTAVLLWFGKLEMTVKVRLTASKRVDILL